MNDSAASKKPGKQGDCRVCGRRGVDVVIRKGKMLCADEDACLAAWRKIRNAS